MRVCHIAIAASCCYQSYKHIQGSTHIVAFTHPLKESFVSHNRRSVTAEEMWVGIEQEAQKHGGVAPRSALVLRDITSSPSDTEKFMHQRQYARCGVLCSREHYQRAGKNNWVLGTKLFLA